MAKSARSKSKKAFRDIKKDKVEDSALYKENTLRKEAATAQAVASGQQARQQRDALRDDSMAVEQPTAAVPPQQEGSAAMDVDSRPGKSKHDKKLKLKMKGKKGQKKGQKPRNPLNIAFKQSNTKLSKAKSFKKKNHRKH